MSGVIEGPATHPPIGPLGFRMTPEQVAVAEGITGPSFLDKLQAMYEEMGLPEHPCLAISGDGNPDDLENLGCSRGRHTDPWHIDGRWRPNVGVLGWRQFPRETEPTVTNNADGGIRPIGMWAPWPRAAVGARE